MDAGMLVVIILVVVATALATTVAVTLLLRRQARGSQHDRTTQQQVLEELTRDAVSTALATSGRELVEQLTRTNEQRLRSQQEVSELQARQSRESLSQVVSPLREELTRLDAQVRSLEQARTEAYARLTSQVQATETQLHSLTQVTSHLDSAMRNNQARGQWGEMQLQRIVELVGLKQHVSFDAQQQQRGEGTGRPDLTVYLTDDKVLYIDAKAPMNAYLRAVEATDAAEQAAHLAEHAQALLGHARSLAARGYLDDGTSIGLVVLFVPNEAALAAALDADRELLAKALERRIAIAGPTSLAMMLTNINASWRQQELATNANAIVDEVLELHKRLATFADHLAKVGRSLDSATSAYNAAIGSFDSRLLPAARRVESLAAVESASRLRDLPPAETQARSPALSAGEAGSGPDRTAADTSATAEAPGEN